MGEVLGVYENYPNSPIEALVIMNDGLVVLENPAPRKMRYDDIAEFELVPKDPLPEHLNVRLYSEAIFPVPVRGRTGEIMTVWTFLIQARTEAQKAQNPGA
jgi:hypothetical protein